MNPALLDLLLLSPTFSPTFLFEQDAMQYSSQSSGAKEEGSAVLAELDRPRERRVPGEYSGDRWDISGEEQVSHMEKDLRDDAPWKRIQQATFTRWVNQQMKTPDKIGYAVHDLYKDLSDGLRLICLIECLSGKKLPRHTTSPVFRSQKLENVSVALNFLENEGIKLVSIDSTDIVDGRLKLILGLIWALILHYSITNARWGDEEEQLVEEKVTPKQRLLSWFANKLPVPVRNFTSDWNDGRACGALDNAMAPGLCPDWETWDSRDALRNATEAMSLAEKWLGVTQLIRPEDMIDPDIDEQSMMTYLSQFPVAKLKEGAPLWKNSAGSEESFSENARSSGSSVTSSTTTSPTSKATGSSQVTETQEVSEDGTTIITRRETRVSKVVSMSSVIESGDMLLQRGSHSQDVRSAISASRSDASKVTVEGNGLHRAYVNKAASINVVADSAGYNMLLVGIYGKFLHSHEVQTKHMGHANYQVTYVLKQEGEYLLSIKYGDVHIPGSPFVINCISQSN